jgi:hypothetical protein
LLSRIQLLEERCNEFQKRERDHEEETRSLKRIVDHLLATVDHLKTKSLTPIKPDTSFDDFMKATEKLKEVEKLVPPPIVRRTGKYPVLTSPRPKDPDVPSWSSDPYVFGSPLRPIPGLTVFPSPL